MFLKIQPYLQLSDLVRVLLHKIRDDVEKNDVSLCFERNTRLKSQRVDLEWIFCNLDSGLQLLA